VLSTKVLDYLLSGVPILVFSPADSHHSLSASEDGWGYVVDRDDPAALAGGLQKLANDQDLRQRLVAQALEEARRRDPRLWAGRLEEQFNRLVQEQRADGSQCRNG
jgi:glycosyltransferase involved in cell wall biosynthesis